MGLCVEYHYITPEWIRSLQRLHITSNQSLRRKRHSIIATSTPRKSQEQLQETNANFPSSSFLASRMSKVITADSTSGIILKPVENSEEELVVGKSSTLEIDDTESKKQVSLTNFVAVQ